MVPILRPGIVVSRSHNNSLLFASLVSLLKRRALGEDEARPLTDIERRDVDKLDSFRVRTVRKSVCRTCKT